MKNRNLLFIILLALFIASCGPSKNENEALFSFNTAAFKEVYQPTETVSLEVLNAQNKKIDSIIYYVNDAKIASKKGAEKLSLPLSDKKLGYQNIKALIYFEGENFSSYNF